MKSITIFVFAFTISSLACSMLKTQVNIQNNKINSVIPNAVGNVMILTVPQFATQFANHLNAILLALSQKMLYVM